MRFCSEALVLCFCVRVLIVEVLLILSEVYVRSLANKCRNFCLYLNLCVEVSPEVGL